MSIDHNGYADFDRDDEFEDDYDPYYDDPAAGTEEDRW